MKKFLLPLLLLIPLTFGFAPLTKPIEAIQAAIVKLEFTSEQGLHYCTGFVTSSIKGEVLTAAHCVPEEKGVLLNVDSKPSKVIRKNNIFALVSIEPFSRPQVKIRQSDTRLGERVTSIGFGYGEFTVFGRGVAVFLKGDIVLDGPLMPGMSGGPVVGEDGEVMGLNQATNGMVGIACGSKEILDFLKGR